MYSDPSDWIEMVLPFCKLIINKYIYNKTNIRIFYIYLMHRVKFLVRRLQKSIAVKNHSLCIILYTYYYYYYKYLIYVFEMP